MINYPKTSNFKLSLLAILSVFFLSGQLHAQEPEIKTEAKKELSFDEKVDQKFKPIADKSDEWVFFQVPIPGVSDKDGNPVKIPFVLALLGGSAVILTLVFGFVNIRGLGVAMRTIKGKYSKSDDPGEISHFQALSAALSATVGLGNIAGVAIAISIGGPGATFWMIVCGLLGMTTKFCECTLGVKYRDIDENGKVYGGAMYYLSKGFAEIGAAGIGKVLAIFFAIACVFGSFGAGNMFQGNQAFQQMVSISGGVNSWFYGKGWFFGLLLAILVGLVIIGGIKSIGKVTSILVPFMCGVYVLCSLYIIFAHFSDIPQALGSIIDGAFSNEAAFGGFIGVLIQGMKRAAFSNEAGFGSAPIAHSAVKTTKPASEGYVALLEPFIDTVVVCTMTALVIIITGAHVPNGSDWTQAIGITSTAFGSVLSWFPYVLFLAVFLFAFSTMISWSYYGQTAWAYLFGRSRNAEILYKLIFCIFIVVGTSANLKSVVTFSDAMVFAMCFPNFIGIYLLLPKIKQEVKIYDEYMAEIDKKN
jgi:alanine or glycine:cation symporter, AGCS family